MELTYDLKLSTAIDTEHPVWGKPFINGKIKAFFLNGVRFGREEVELLQRMDADYGNVTIDKVWSLNKWGIGDFYHKRLFPVLYENLEIAMTSKEHFECLVIPGVNGWGCFSGATRKAILDRVAAGAGLVLVQPFDGEGYPEIEELSKLSPLKPLYKGGNTSGEERNPELDKLRRGRWVANKHYITGGVPFELLPYSEMAYYPYEANGEVIIRSEKGDPIAAVKEYGKGRVVAFGYYPRDILPQHGSFEGWDPCYEPIVANWHGASHSLEFNYLEYFYSLINRSMVWAARKEPRQQITAIKAGNGEIAVEHTGGGQSSIFAVIKNSYDEIVKECETVSGTIPLPEQLKYGGEYRIDLYLKEGGLTADWGTAAISFPLVICAEHLTVGSKVIKPGEVLSGSVDVVGTEGEVELQVLDDFDRVLHRAVKAVSSSGSFKISYTVEASPKSMHLRVRVLVSINGHLVQRHDSHRVIVTPQDRDFHDYEVFICPQNRGQGDLSPVENARLLEMGGTGLFIGDNKMSTLSGAGRLGINWNEREPYCERKEKYLKTKDKQYLHRLTCLNDPQLWRDNENLIIETVSRNSKYGPVSYFANDEGSLTCYTDELDLCFCPHCMTEMREWLKKEYGSLDRLNRSWGTDFGAWEAVEPNTYLEAKKTGEFASWGDHRRFMELTFADAYRKIRDYIRTVDPAGKVRMSGTQMSTPFSGYDYYALHQCIGYFEAYSGGNQYELHRSFANPGTVLGGWFGYGSSGMTVQHSIWHAVLHGLSLMSVFWEYSCLNPDFTFSKSAEDMGRVFREIRREGIGKLLLYGVKRDSLGIAVHYSMPSIHGAYLRENPARFENNRQGWINLLEDMGYQYDMIASQQIEAGMLAEKGYKLLILPYSIALSEKEAEMIKEFASGGGIVMGDFQTGIMDVHCKLFDCGCLDELFGIERLTTDTQPFYVDMELTRNEDFTYFDNLYLYGSPDFQFAESGTRPTTGKAAYVQDFSGTVPAVVINEYGSGKGIYLNLSMDRYPALRKEESSGCDTRKLMKELLKFAGIEKFASLSTADGELVECGYETVYYSDCNAEYVAIQRDLTGKARVGYDGLAIGNVKDNGEAAGSLMLKLRKKAHVYDIREKKYMGFSDMVDTAIAPGDVKLFSLLPYKVVKLYIEVRQTVTRGDEITALFKVFSDKPEGAYNNILSINLYNPAGEFEWIYSGNFSTNATSFERTYRIPYNEKTGKWRIVATDVASGVSTEKSFEVI